MRCRATRPARCSSANCACSSWAATRRRSAERRAAARARARGRSGSQPTCALRRALAA
jgi:hypothetical protein